jgi:SpoU rRNA Methylase family
MSRITKICSEHILKNTTIHDGNVLRSIYPHLLEPFDSLRPKRVYVYQQGKILRVFLLLWAHRFVYVASSLRCLLSQNLLTFLRSHRERGYYIVGLEQTSSSVSLDGFRFPDQPILLLLGKEKEGIPVEFLQAVDQCVEIPQMGITRSLNVHVSGAIAIWEHTKQRMGGIP